MKRLLGFLFSRWVLAALGLLAVCLLIWWVGPAVQVFRYAPLAPAWVRWSLIAGVCVAALVRIALVWARGLRASAALSAGLTRQASTPAPGPRDEEAAVLKERFETALQTLRKTDLGAGRRSAFARVTSLVSGSYLYELPWYVFIGAPGSGKTTALVNSGLQFPLAERFGRDAIRGVAGTRNCDWWFTDEAILLDTAGRYTTQESDREVDAAGWRAFLQLLKNTRPRRPINGVLLTVSVADLLQQSRTEREAHAQALRRRLQELYRGLNVRFPVYVLITKADLLAGFNEFFAVLGKEDREQVWGVSLPYAQDASGFAALPKELTRLERRLYDQLTKRLHDEPDPARRALIYAFPQQFTVAAARLGELLESLFAPSKYEVTPLLRGAYFTSGTQEGSPVDRVLGQLARAYGLERKLLPPQRASGRSYFLTRLLKEVVFREAGLAGTNLKWEQRRALVQFGAVAAAVAVVMVASFAWLVSYRHNAFYLGEVALQLEEAKQEVAALAAQTGADPLNLLPTLSTVHTLSRTRATSDGVVPWSLGFGLYQGDKLERASQAAYRNLLNDAFLPALVLRLEAQLRSGFTGNPDLLYEGLKAYVMLQDGEHFDQPELQAWYALDWRALMPREVTNEQRGMLAMHLNALFENGWIQPPAPQDEALLAQTRSAIARTPLAHRIYARLRRLDVAKDYADFTLSAKVPHAELVFVRANGEPLTQGVPALYTYDAYHNAFAEQADAAARRLAYEEPWVMASGKTVGGLSALGGVDAGQVTDAVKRLYLEDYREHWEAFVRSVAVARKRDLKETIDLARLLSDPTANNPVKRMYLAVARETRLSQAPQHKADLLDKAEEKAKRTLKDLERLLPGMGGSGPQQPPAMSLERMLVDDHFAELHAFAVGPGEGQPAPIDAAIGLMNEIYAMLSSTQRALDEKTPPPPSPTADKARVEAARYPEPLRSMVAALAQAGAGQAGGLMMSNLNRLLQAEVTDFCVKAITSRYPFQRGSRSDVTREDFSRLFGPGGVLDGFYQKHLMSLVDTSSGRWKFRPTQGIPMRAGEDLVQFQRAAVIREVFFHGAGASAGLQFEFRPIEMDETIQQFILDVDGQLVKYAHGPQVPTAVQFPGPRAAKQVRISISPAAPSGTSGLVFDGPWALFRLFDGVQIQPTAQPERFRAIINVEGRKAVFEVLASSVQNPFRMRELAEFRCPSVF